MTLRELLEVVDSEIYISEKGDELCMVNAELCDFECVIDEKLLNKNVSRVYVFDGNLKVVVDER